MDLPARLSSAKSRITALAFKFNNADSVQIEAAAQNAANNCPAFWHKASYSNAVVGGFMFYLNQTQDVLRAIEACEAAEGSCRMGEVRFLDALLPLNVAAARSLGEAYEAFSTFRTERELIDRTFKAEGINHQAMTPAEVVGAVPLNRVVELV